MVGKGAREKRGQLTISWRNSILVLEKNHASGTDRVLTWSDLRNVEN